MDSFEFLSLDLSDKCLPDKIKIKVQTVFGSVRSLSNVLPMEANQPPSSNRVIIAANSKGGVS
jgi:hypothetical protein